MRWYFHWTNKKPYKINWLNVCVAHGILIGFGEWIFQFVIGSWRSKSAWAKRSSINITPHWTIIAYTWSQWFLSNTIRNKSTRWKTSICKRNKCNFYIVVNKNQLFEVLLCGLKVSEYRSVVQAPLAIGKNRTQVPASAYFTPSSSLTPWKFAWCM